MIKKILDRIILGQWAGATILRIDSDELTIEQNRIIDNDCASNVYLLPNVNVWVKSNFKGSVIGDVNNRVRISGNYEGFIFSEMLQMDKNGSMSGTVSVNKLMLKSKPNFAALTIPQKHLIELTALDFSNNSILKQIDQIKLAINKLDD